MKLIINYDFFNVVKDVNEPMSPYKVMRNNKRFNAFVALPWFLTVNIFNFKSDLTKSILVLPLQFSIITLLETLDNMLSHQDKFKDKAEYRLKKLVRELNDLNVSTDYDLLLKSEVYHKKYQIHLNKDKLPCILESKYILVPTYNFNGNIKDTSILQEHEVGSKSYVLSLGSYQKKHELAYNNI